MVAWTGIEHFRMGRFDPPPPAVESEDFVVGFKLLNTNNCLPFVLFCPSFITVYTSLYTPPFHPTPPPPPLPLKSGNIEEGIVVAWREKGGKAFFWYMRFIFLHMKSLLSLLWSL